MAKKKILLMSDDLRMHSGVATVSKDIVFETLHEYDWVQIGGAIKHPDTGKIINMDELNQVILHRNQVVRHLNQECNRKIQLYLHPLINHRHLQIRRLQEIKKQVVFQREC